MLNPIKKQLRFTRNCFFIWWSGPGLNRLYMNFQSFGRSDLIKSLKTSGRDRALTLFHYPGNQVAFFRVCIQTVKLYFKVLRAGDFFHKTIQCPVFSPALLRISIKPLKILNKSGLRCTSSMMRSWFSNRRK